MKLIREVSGFSQLETFASGEWDKVGELVKYIIDSKKETLFNFLADNHFLNGTNEDKFKDWCCGNADYILDYLKSHKVA